MPHDIFNKNSSVISCRDRPRSEGSHEIVHEQHFVLSETAYELLEPLSESGHGAKIFDIDCGCITLADDLTCNALSPKGLQNMLYIVQQYAYKWRFKINSDKSFIVIFTNCSTKAYKDI